MEEKRNGLKDLPLSCPGHEVVFLVVRVYLRRTAVKETGRVTRFLCFRNLARYEDAREM